MDGTMRLVFRQKIDASQKTLVILFLSGLLPLSRHEVIIVIFDAKTLIYL
jgi:hypothetical protein